MKCDFAAYFSAFCFSRETILDQTKILGNREVDSRAFKQT